MFVQCDKEARQLLLGIGDALLRGGGRQSIPLFNALEQVTPSLEEVIEAPKPEPKKDKEGKNG